MINSIREQSYDNWELFIIDDGSTDKTWSMIEELSESRIKYIQFNENRGHPVAIYESNVLNQITGDLVIFTGSDDIFIENSFNLIIDNFSDSADDVWKMGFLWKGELDKNKYKNKFEHFNASNRYLSNEIMSDRYTQSDYLFVYRRVFWEKYQDFFASPNHFFTSFYDVAMMNAYIEIIKKECVMIAGWDSDNVTKGNNAEIYFNWATFTRRYLYDRYSSNMSREYLNYTVRSLIINLLNSKGKRLDSLKYFFRTIFYQAYDLVKILLLIPAFFFPSFILFKIKKILFSIRSRR